MAEIIATEGWIRDNFGGSGTYTSNLCATKARALVVGNIKITGTYDNNQLVPRSAISAATKPFIRSTGWMRLLTEEYFFGHEMNLEYSYAKKGVANSIDANVITIENCPNFFIYIASYAEINYDYTIAMSLDTAAPTAIGSAAYNSAGVIAHTKGNYLTKTALNGLTLNEPTKWVKVEYPNDGGRHTITVCFRKDSSTNSGEDCGYVLIPAESDILNKQIKNYEDDT